jgi:hypothetical protein
MAHGVKAATASARTTKRVLINGEHRIRVGVHRFSANNMVELDSCPPHRRTRRKTLEFCCSGDLHSTSVSSAVTGLRWNPW